MLAGRVVRCYCGFDIRITSKKIPVSTICSVLRPQKYRTFLMKECRNIKSEDRSGMTTVAHAKQDISRKNRFCWDAGTI
jgi:hypothetical protein